MDFKNLRTDEERRVEEELLIIIPIIKNKYFSLGREMDRMAKLLDQLEKLSNKNAAV